MEELKVIKDFRLMGWIAKKDDLIIKTSNVVKLIFIDEHSKKIESITMDRQNFSCSEMSRLDDCILLYTE